MICTACQSLQQSDRSRTQKPNISRRDRRTRNFKPNSNNKFESSTSPKRAMAARSDLLSAACCAHLRWKLSDFHHKNRNVLHESESQRQRKEKKRKMTKLGSKEFDQSFDNRFECIKRPTARTRMHRI